MTSSEETESISTMVPCKCSKWMKGGAICLLWLATFLRAVWAETLAECVQRVPSLSQQGEQQQIMQRFFPDLLTRHRGFFVEIGALNGKSFSNTNVFEDCYGWNGILIEGNPTNFAELQVNRPDVITIGEAVCPEGVNSVTFTKNGGAVAADVSAMSKEYKDTWGWAQGSETVDVPCRPISAMFREHGVTHIDFWSLDVEGAELKVLQTMDFKAVKVKVLIVEKDGQGHKERDEAVAEVLRKSDLCEIDPSDIQGSSLWVNQASKFAHLCKTKQ